ncbi:MAG: hypothetical protein MO846_05715 [Candidatus Devosia symbiotica]|nr:hypothetical protein [Candidatus Devosia symbiotica]
MPVNTKTYWRVLGETGLPTELNFSDPVAIIGHEIFWLYPTLETEGGFSEYVYYGPTILPIEVTLAPGDTMADMTAVLGICSDICVPAQAWFSLALIDPAPDRANGLRLRQAMVIAPMGWDRDPQPIGNVVFDARTSMLKVQVDDPELDQALLIAATATRLPLFSAPQKSPESNLVLFPVLGDVGETDLATQPVQPIFRTDMGVFAIDLSVKVTPAQLESAQGERPARPCLRGQSRIFRTHVERGKVLPLGGHIHRAYRDMIERGSPLLPVPTKLVDANGFSDTTSDAVLGQGLVVLFTVPGALP